MTIDPLRKSRWMIARASFCEDGKGAAPLCWFVGVAGLELALLAVADTMVAGVPNLSKLLDRPQLMKRRVRREVAIS